jgi:hypothetical protein
MRHWPWLAGFLALAAVAAAALPIGTSAESTVLLPAPTGLKTFLTSVNEPPSTAQSADCRANGVREFPSTPAFAWSPVRGADHYQFELSTSAATSEAGFLAANGLIWSSKTLTTPATAIPLSLPWINGNPASLYWHVRAVVGSKVSPWSGTESFNMGWCTVPQQEPTAAPGYVRWSPVPGATSYQVWFTNLNPQKIIATITNVADEREYFTFHDSQSWIGTVKWRVRAVRAAYGQAKNDLPSVSYGPWSSGYTSLNPGDPTAAAQDVKPLETNSDVTSTLTKPRQHHLMPAFLFTGSGDTNAGLHRVYVFSDKRCVNVVFKGAIVGGPAYAPRTTGPLALPADAASLDAARNGTQALPDGAEGQTYTADFAPVKATEAGGDSTGGATQAAGSAATGTTATTTAAPTSMGSAPKIDLWDRQWPGGRYYWTVVPVSVTPQKGATTTLSTGVDVGVSQLTVASSSGFNAGVTVTIGAESAKIASVSPNLLTLAAPLQSAHLAGATISFGGGLVYQDTQLAQDKCEAGGYSVFGKHSADPVPANQAEVPFATGLSPSGRLLTAASKKTAFYGPPLVAWEPAPAASSYDVEWSKTSYPWRPAGHISTPATSAVLPLTAGTWYYRVRGVNDSIPGNQKMQWSPQARIVIAKPIFKVFQG